MKHSKPLESLGLRDLNAGVWSGSHGWSTDSSGPLIESTNPATGQRLAQVRGATLADYEHVMNSALAAAAAWRRVPAPKRGEAVRQVGEELRAFKDALGSLVSMENGKIKAEGDGEVQEMIDIADFAVGQSRMLYGNTMHSERAQHRMYEQWHPLGVVGVISAFNFPVAVWAWNAFLAAISGNATVWKPSPKTSLCALAVQHICNRVLQRRRDAESVELMHLAQLAREQGRCDAIAGAPARRVQRLAEGKYGEAALPQFGVSQHRGVPTPIEDHAFVYLVGEDADRAVAHHGRERVEIGMARDAAARVLRTVHDHETGARGETLAYPVPIEGERRRHQRDAHTAAARETHRGLVSIVSGVENHRLVTRAYHRLDGVVEGFGRPASHGDFAERVDGNAVTRRELGRDQLAQRNDTLHGRVLTVTRRHGLDERLRETRINGVVGKSLADIERTFLDRAARHDGEDRGADIGQLAVEAHVSAATLAGRRRASGR